MHSTITLSVLAVLVFPSNAGRIYYEASQIDPSMGAWTGWYDTDNASGEGDKERVEDIAQRFMGRGCSHIVPCKSPIAMELDISYHHSQQYPDSNIDDVLACSVVHMPNPNEGFICLNQDQAEAEVPQECLPLCSQNGLGNNCQKCADFQVRYFCLYDEYICDNKKSAKAWKHNLLLKILQAVESK